MAERSQLNYFFAMAEKQYFDQSAISSRLRIQD